MDWIMEPWPWYISGPMIAFVMFLLLMMGRKLGMSSNLRTLCAICGAGKRATFFDYDWKAQKWNLIVVTGVILGGFLASNFLMNEKKVDIHEDVVKDLNAYGFASADEAYLPKELYAAENLSDPKVLALLIIGGLFIGFGTRYAGGCTSGHAISGLSSLQLPSLLAVIGFFAGGLIMIHFVFPLIF
ncbi:MAG: YeeE/YedE thiosulfate transporter family protein [Vicingaceae bacterium]